VKKIIVGIILCCCISFAFSQGYLPMVTDSVVWSVDARNIGDIPPNEDYSEQIIISGDTIVNSIAYKKVYLKRNWRWLQYAPIEDVIVCGGQSDLLGLIREDTVDRKVFFLGVSMQNSFPTETILFDFDPNVGDTVGQTGFVVDSFGYRNINIGGITNQVRTIFIKHPGSEIYLPPFGAELVPALGTDEGLFGIHFPIIRHELSNDQRWLKCYQRNGVYMGIQPYIPTYEDCNCHLLCCTNAVDNFYQSLFSVSPNPVKESILISNVTSQCQVSIFNTLGNIVFEGKSNNNNMQLQTSAWHPGIYIIKVQDKAGATFKKVIKL
jgi:hypothetical protein